VAPLPPRLGQVRADRARGAADLVRERIGLFLREGLRQFKKVHRGCKGFLKNLKVTMGLNLLAHLVTLSPCHLVTLSPCHLVIFKESPPSRRTPATARAAPSGSPGSGCAGTRSAGSAPPGRAAASPPRPPRCSARRSSCP